MCAGSERDQNNLSVKEKRHRWQIALNYTPLIRSVEVSDSRKKRRNKNLYWFTGFCGMGDQKSKALVPWCLWSLARRYCHKYTEYILYENTWAILPRFCHFFKLKIQMCLFLVSGSISVGVASPSLTWCPAPDLYQPHQPRPATSQLVLFLLLNLLTWVLSSVCAGLCVPAWIPACLPLLQSTAWTFLARCSLVWLTISGIYTKYSQK